MLNRLLAHLTKYNISTDEQYGFSPKLTAENATYHFTNEILKFEAFMATKLDNTCSGYQRY
jgi:hypothetical protein